MALSTSTLIYIIFGGMSFFGLCSIILFVSGKSIFFDFYRRIFPKGCDLYIINGNRQVSHFYKIPKDGVFRVAKKMYITNPDKIMSLSDDMKKEIAEKITKKEKKFTERINAFEEKKKVAEDVLSNLDVTDTNTGEINDYKEYVRTLADKIALLKSKRKEREQVYYNERRGAFFYIEGDPIPKDFHELYTEMDSIAIDNVIARSMTKDPKAVRNLEKELKTMKFLIIVAIIAAGVAAVIAITIKTDIQTIAQAVGATLTL